MILVARIVGQKQFGEFGMVQSTLGVAGMMAGFGLGSTATRFVAQYSVINPARAGRVVALVNLSSWGLVITAGLIISLGAGPIARDFLHAEHLQDALVSGTLLMMAMTIRGVQAGVLAGLDRFDVIAKINVLEGAASFLGLVGLTGLFGFKGGLLGLGLGIMVAWLVGQVALQSTLRDHRLRVIYKDCWSERGILSGYSLPSFLANLVATPVLWFGMTLVAGRASGYDDLALYNAAYQWHGPLIFLPMILLSVCIPVLVQQWEQGYLQGFRKVFLWNVGFMLAITAMPLLVIALLSPWIMGLFGDGFKNGKTLLILIIAAAPFHAISKTAATALLGMNRAWSVFWLNLMWGGVMLNLSLLLIPSWGALGLAVAFLTAYCLQALTASSLVFWYLHNASKNLPLKK